MKKQKDKFWGNDFYIEENGDFILKEDKITLGFSNKVKVIEIMGMKIRIPEDRNVIHITIERSINN